MTQEPRQTPALFTHVDVTSGASGDAASMQPNGEGIMIGLMQQLVAGQQRHNELLEELVKQLGTTQRQRANELGQWKKANPDLAKSCRTAAESLSQAQTRFLESLTEDISENGECLMDGEFMLNEFVDRYGPRLAHLNGVLHVLSQLSSVPNPTNTTQ